VHYENSALAALASANPNFPRQPIAFPGQYGSAWARFDQRSDGRLDFTFYGSTFIPLGSQLGGSPVRWALPFCGPDQFSSIPASGMALHPHLHLTTREPVGGNAGVPELPANTVHELTLTARNSSFGDKFTLNSAELGGGATGRSHLMGRLEIQFGPRFGDAMPIAIAGLSPGALMAPPPDSPLTAAFPGRLSPGPLGHDEHLHFPLRNYFLDGVALVDDPFDLAVGAVDLRTGRLLSQLLRRGFIAQDLFYALIRVEPRTPQSSFFFRGPALFESAGDGTVRFRFRGGVSIPYPEGFRFPGPDLTSSFMIGRDSRLDPFVWLQACEDAPPPRHGRQGARRQMRASNGEDFSFSYRVPADPGREPASFEYENHSQGGLFRMDRLAWYGFTRSRAVGPGGEPDVTTFAGFGTWSRDAARQPHVATVQIADGSLPYVSVQIDGGLVSNVNTRPSNLADAQP
jgi:hypothetical protein